MVASVRMIGFAEAIAKVPHLADETAKHNQMAAEHIGQRARSAVSTAAPGRVGAKVTFAKDARLRAGTRVLVRVSHPAANSFEWGRTKYYASRSPGTPSGIGNNRPRSKRHKGSVVANSVVVRRAGFRKRPFALPSIERIIPELQRFMADGFADGFHDVFGGH